MKRDGWANTPAGTGSSPTLAASSQARPRGAARSAARAGGGWFPFTIRDAEFRDGAMLPRRAALAYDDGDAFAGPLSAGGVPADGACGAFVRGADGGRFHGRWPAMGVPP
jgi:hypothetical protein